LTVPPNSEKASPQLSQISADDPEDLIIDFICAHLRHLRTDSEQEMLANRGPNLSSGNAREIFQSQIPICWLRGAKV
jgi:hypothetical protein